MNYTFFAISCYILLRGIRFLFEDYKDRSWYKVITRVFSAVAIIAALASLIVWYKEIPILGFKPD